MQFIDIQPNDIVPFVSSLTIFFCTVMVYLFWRGFSKNIHNKLEKTKNQVDDAIWCSLQLPGSAFIWLMGSSLLIDDVQKHFQMFHTDSVVHLRSLAIICLVAWVLQRFLSALEPIWLASKDSREIDSANAMSIIKIGRGIVIVVTVLAILQTLGVSVSGILAFGGVGGIVVGFAAKDMLANFFGGLMIFWERPFSIGDWIRSPDRNIEGTVEKLGWRVTLIRTFDKRPLYVPNSLFSNIALENPSRMYNRRIRETIGVRYCDADKVEKIIEDVRQMLSAHPDIDQSQLIMVNLNTLGTSAIEFFIYTFTKTTDWASYHMVKENVLLRIIAIVSNNHAEIAFPTQTIHLEKSPMEI